MRTQTNSPGSFRESAGLRPAGSVTTQLSAAGKMPAFLLILLIFSSTIYAQAPRLTLSVEKQDLQWQDDVVLTLEVLGAPASAPPEVTVEGLERFELRGSGKNLLVAPGRMTKWILTYSLTATRAGAFKLGPAKFPFNGRTYYSNILLLTVESPQKQTPPPQAAAPPPTPPVVMSPRQVGDKIQLIWESQKNTLYRNEPVIVTLKLLSQLIVENLRYEVDFPGFLKYDFPFSAQPRADWVQHRGAKYAVYELQKFLLFPLHEGAAMIPVVSSELKVRVPSGKFREADLRFTLTRAASSLKLKILPVPASALVGSFVLRNQILSDQPRLKRIALILEGEGQLSTFDFPELTGPDFHARIAANSTKFQLQRQKPKSVKITEYEVSPTGSATRIVLPAITLSQFDPRTGRTSQLLLPQLRLTFDRPGKTQEPSLPLPDTQDRITPVVFLLLLGLIAYTSITRRRDRTAEQNPKFTILVRGKKKSLQVSRKAAQNLYRHMNQMIVKSTDGKGELMEALLQHLPKEEWLESTDLIRKLEWTAFSPAKAPLLTYGEVKVVCEKMEKQWQA